MSSNSNEIPGTNLKVKYSEHFSGKKLTDIYKELQTNEKLRNSMGKDPVEALNTLGVEFVSTNDENLSDAQVLNEFYRYANSREAPVISSEGKTPRYTVWVPIILGIIILLITVINAE